MEREINRKADEVVERYITKKYKDAVQKVLDTGENCHISELVENINDVNSWTKMVTGDDEELYENYKMHIFVQDGQVFVLRGKELND